MTSTKEAVSFIEPAEAETPSTGIAERGAVSLNISPRTTPPNRWPEVLAVALFLGVVGALYSAILRATNGHFIYVLDDPYISAAMAKNLVHHGILGVTQYGFSSSSSSIVWPFLISAVDVIFGVHSSNSLFLNIALGIVLIVFCGRILLRIEPKTPTVYTVLWLTTLIFLTPLTGLTFVGLEHILHTIATVGFAYFSATTLSEGDRQAQSPISRPLVFFSVLVTLARYEGIFLIAIVVVLFACKRYWSKAIILTLGGLLPIISFGLWSVVLGWLFVPNPVLLKGGELKQVLKAAVLFQYTNKLYFQSDVRLFVIIAGILLLAGLMRGRGIWDSKQLLLLMFVTTTLLHMQFAAVGWFFRYEAYLVAFGITAIAAGLYEYVERIYLARDKAALALCAVIVGAFVLHISVLRPRSSGVLSQIPIAARNIYEQQYQMARFLRKYYSGSTVAANDIGAIDYFADIHCLDLYGLGSVAVTRSKRDHTFTTKWMETFVAGKQGRIAIIYDQWYQQYGGVPRDWDKVGSWSIRNNVVAGSNTVSFYAINVSDRTELMMNLKAFSSELPADVIQSGSYTRE